jgi:hypothetical protein
MHMGDIAFETHDDISDFIDENIANDNKFNNNNNRSSSSSSIVYNNQTNAIRIGNNDYIKMNKN